MLLRNNKGFSMLELLVAMTVATVIMAISLQIFESGMKVKEKQVEARDVENNLRIAMDYIRNDITEAGSFMGDQGFFNYYDPGIGMNRQFCVDFSNTNWPDWANLQAAWTAKFPGWNIDYSDDMIELWYADGNTYSPIKPGATNKIQSLVNIDIEDNPAQIGFQVGDYVLFYDTGKDDTIAAVRGSESRNSWVTVLTGIIQLTGNNTTGTLLFDQALPFADPYKTPYGHNLCSYIVTKTQFSSPDRIYLVHRVVYGLISKSVYSGGVTEQYKMLVRDDFRDPTGASRYNPQVVSTNMEHMMFTSIFKLPIGEAGVNPYNWYNSVRLAYHYTSNNKMFSRTLGDAIGTPISDVANEDLTDNDPRDLRFITVEMSGKSRKRFLEFVANPSNAPKNMYSPEMGVVEYSTGGADVRLAAGTSPDFYKHYKLTSQVGLRTLRMTDFAVNPD
jgi:prepilin-type N-terminal cleavage/methylation domain-containing protein